MSATVSVIIPTFNRSVLLAEAIDSVLGQTHGDLEVVVVDDGSTDGTEEIVAQYVARDPRVRYRRQPNAGAAAARNAGLTLAVGAFIGFLDSDDVWQPWHLALMLAGLARLPGVGLIWSDIALVDGTGELVAAGGLRRLFSGFERLGPDRLFDRSTPIAELDVALDPPVAGARLFEGDVFSAMVLGNLILTSATVMRRELMDAVGPFDEKLQVGEDYEYFLRACRLGPVAFADVADVRYRVGTPDKLVRRANAVPMALAYQQVLESTLRRDGARISLTPRQVAAARARADRWVGSTQLASGAHRSARRNLLRSLRWRPWQPAVVGMLAATIAPSSAVQWLLRRRRQVLHRA
jgi:GT2 family glycosyltransferase